MCDTPNLKNIKTKSNQIAVWSSYNLYENNDIMKDLRGWYAI